MNTSMKEMTMELLLRYGFQVLGAIAILAVGFLVARWLGRMADQRFQKQQMEPPMRILLVRVTKILVLVMAFVVALDKFGFSIAPWWPASAWRASAWASRCRAFWATSWRA